MEVNVRHEPKANRFAARIGDKIAYLSYEKEGEKILNYAHTWTPPKHRGKGIAAKITKAALDYARENGFSVIPSCPYVNTFIKKHPEYQDMIKTEA